MITYFKGYNHTLACQEGEFFDMKNVTTKNYPVLSVRDRRGVCKSFNSLNGILDKESLIWIDGTTLYIDNEAKELSDGVELTEGQKTMCKMGAYIVIFPDKVWYNVDSGESGYMEAKHSVASETTVSFALVNTNGESITWHDESYWSSHTPKDGDYMMSTLNGKTSLKVYSSSTSLWVSVATTYLKIASEGIGKDFKKEDGIKITIDNSSALWSYAENIFVNTEDDGRLSMNTYITDKGDDYITIIGLLDANISFDNLPMEVARAVPDMPYITECQNRLWGCSEDGHEIYCCKLGDVTNWNCFMGISTDSYAATVGSDGKFTGAVTYNQNPIFFKENSLLKVTVGQAGNHSYRETNDKGVQEGSSKSICIVNGVLYYKHYSGICAYDGSYPVSISKSLGVARYYEAVGGTIRDRYYVNMKDAQGKSHMFVYDTQNGLWAKEDNISVRFFCKHSEELYFVDSQSNLKSVSGMGLYDSTDMEKPIDWMVESGSIGFALPDAKYVSRINVRMQMEVGSYADFYFQYDSEGSWVHVFNVSGSGTKTFNIPVTPRRCDHFKYRISGHGACKIFSITKQIEEGSDGQ